VLDSDDDEPRPLVPLIDARGRSTDCPGRTPKLIQLYGSIVRQHDMYLCQIARHLERIELNGRSHREQSDASDR
jgi:hypothetical protein